MPQCVKFLQVGGRGASQTARLTDELTSQKANQTWFMVQILLVFLRHIYKLSMK